MTQGLNQPAVRRGLALLIRMLGNYRREAAFSILAALVWMAMVVVLPLVQKVVIDTAIEGNEPDLLLPLVGIVLMAGLLKAAGIGGRRYFAFQLSYRAETDLRNRIFEHIQRLAFSFHDRTATGELMARASSDLSQVRLIFAMLPISLANLGLLSGVAVILVILDPVLGLLAALSVPALLLLAWWYARTVVGVSFEVQERLADMSAVVEEGIAGVRVTKAFGQEEPQVARVEDVTDRIYDSAMQLARHRSNFSPIFEMIPALVGLLVLFVGGNRVAQGVMTLGDFVAFSQYLVILVFPLRITGWFFAELPRATAAAARVVDLLRTAPEIEEPSAIADMPSGPGEIRFSDVFFSYPDGPPVLNGLDLTVPGGSSVAVVGTTGSGKTTLAYLVPRLYDVDSGQISVDGTDVRMLSLEELRNEVAVVFEEPFLFSASIRDNIAVGDPDASDEHIRLAARLSQAHAFIVNLPDGYDTVVGERGLSLSGGQRQRVALARAVIRDPRVLILDDATSAVDAVTEEEIRRALKEVMAGRTTLIIAHRTSTLALADRVVLIDEGKAVAHGTHQELLAAAPRYSEILAEGDSALKSGAV